MKIVELFEDTTRRKFLKGMGVAGALGLLGAEKLAKAAEFYSTDTSYDDQMRKILSAVNSEIPLEKLHPYSKGALKALLMAQEKGGKPFTNTAFLRAFTTPNSDYLSLAFRIVKYIGQEFSPEWESELAKKIKPTKAE